MWEGIFTLSFYLKEGPVKLLVRNLCLIPQSCLRLRSTAADLFPGSGFPVFAVSDWLRPEPDSSSTGGVYCVSGRIPALSVSDCMYHTPFWIGVFASAHDISAIGRADFERYPSRSAPRRVCPEYLIVLCIGLRKLLDQKRKQSMAIACHVRTLRLHFFFYVIRVCIINITSSSKPSCPLSRYQTRTSDLFSH